MVKSGSSVAAIIVLDLARELYERGIVNADDVQAIDSDLYSNMQALIRQQDLSEVIEQRYPEAWLVALWRLAEQRAPDSALGIEMGAKVSYETIGLVNNIMQHCSTLEEVMEVCLKSFPLVNPADTWRPVFTDDLLTLVFNFRSDFRYPRCAVERNMVYLYQWSCLYTGQQLPLIAAEFTYQKPDYVAEIRRQLPGALRFGMSENALIFSHSVLKTPVKTSHPYVKKILSHRAEQVAGTVLSGRPFTDKVRAILSEDLAHSCSQTEVAQMLHMSRSTLSRKLKEEGASFSALLNAVRLQTASEFGHLPVKTLIEKLGFHDESSYYKARKKWQEQGDL